MSRSLGNQKIKNSYPYLLQRRDGIVLDGDGNVVNLEGRVVLTDHTSGSLSGLSVYWFADTTSGSVQGELNPEGDKIFIKDSGGNASNDPIYIYAPTGQTINGNASEAIDVDWGWVEYYRVGSEWKTLAGQGYIPPAPEIPTPEEVGAIPATEKGAANGVATLGADGVLVEDTDYAAWYVANGWYGPNAITINNQSWVVGVFTSVAAPMMIWRDIEIDRLSFNVDTNGGVGSTCRIALYQESLTSNLLELVAGSDVLLDTSANGTILTVVDCALKKGVVWIAFVNLTGTSPVTYTGYTGKDDLLYKDETRVYTTPTVSSTRLTGDDVSAGFPASTPKIVNVNANPFAPLIYFRVKP